jgi:putative peptidoglycan lipid II flippase
MDAKNIIKNVGKVSVSTFMSRLLGYARDMVIANYFGAVAAADAFYIAYRIPNLLRSLLGEGALVSSFIPVYTGYLSHKSEEDTKKFLGNMITFLGIVLVTITILGIIFTPYILKVIAPGFDPMSPKFHLAVLLTRIMFPFFIAVGFSAFFMGILNVHHLFFYPAIAPCLLSITELIFVFFVCPYMSLPVKGLAYSVVVGGIIQTVYQIYPIVKQNIKFTFNLNFKDEGLIKVLLLMIPAAIGVSIDQVSNFVDMMFASWLKEGSISALYYANRLTLFPMGLFAVAIATVSLPALSKSASLNNMKEFKTNLLVSLKFMVYGMMPALAGLVVLAYPLIRLLFQHGKFDNTASLLTTDALVFYSIGLLSFASAKILSSAFYSLKDTKTPVKIGIIAVILNAELNLIFMGNMGVGGLALATSLSSTFDALALLYLLRKRIGGLGLKKMSVESLKVFVSCVLMAVCVWYTYKFFDYSRVLSVVVPISLGALVYFTATHLFKVEESKYIKAVLNKIMLRRIRA